MWVRARLTTCEISQHVALAGHDPQALTALRVLGERLHGPAIHALADLAEADVPNRGEALFLFTYFVGQLGDRQYYAKARSLHLPGVDRLMERNLTVYWTVRQLAELENPEAVAILERLRGTALERAGLLEPRVQEALCALAKLLHQPVFAVWKSMDIGLVIRALRQEPEQVTQALLHLHALAYEPVETVSRVVVHFLERRRAQPRYQPAFQLMALHQLEKERHQLQALGERVRSHGDAAAFRLLVQHADHQELLDVLASMINYDHLYQTPAIWLVQQMAAAGIPEASHLLSRFYLMQDVLLPREVLRTSKFIAPVWPM